MRKQAEVRSERGLNTVRIPFFVHDLCSAAAHAAYTILPWPGRAETNRSRRQSFAARTRYYGLTTPEQEAVMLESLRAQVAYCREHVPYYRTLLKELPLGFPEDLEEYRQIPALDKSALRQAGDLLVSEAFRPQDLRKASTGGSTGEPISVYLTQSDQGLGEAGNELFMRKIGGGAGRRIGTLYGGDLDVRARPRKARQIKDWIWNYSSHGCFRLDEAYLLAVHSDFEAARPDVLLGYATAVYLLAVTLRNRRIAPSYPRHAVLTAAEKLEEEQRTVIEEVFRVPVVERYGSRDAGLMAYQLPGESRFWVDHWDYLIEPECAPDTSSRAPILVTRLHTKGMPLLRYRIGDMAIFPTGWQPQGHVQWLDGIAGRTLALIHLPDGQFVHGSEFPHLFKDLDVILYQVSQAENGNVMVSIVPGRGFDPRQREYCESIIRANLEGLAVDFQYVKVIDRTWQNKLSPVISRLATG